MLRYIFAFIMCVGIIFTTSQPVTATQLPTPPEQKQAHTIYEEIDALIQADKTRTDLLFERMKNQIESKTSATTNDVILANKKTLDDFVTANTPVEANIFNNSESYNFLLSGETVSDVKNQLDSNFDKVNNTFRELFTQWVTSIETEDARIAEEARIKAEQEAEAERIRQEQNTQSTNNTSNENIDNQSPSYSSEDSLARLYRIANGLGIEYPTIVISDDYCTAWENVLGCYAYGYEIYVTSYGLTKSDCYLRVILAHEIRHWQQAGKTGFAEQTFEELEADAHAYSQNFAC